MKQRITRLLVKSVKKLGVEKIFLNTPHSYMPVKEWISTKTADFPSRFITVEKPSEITEKPPVVVGSAISGRFTRYYRRSIKEAFVAVVPGARVLGEFSNIILSPDNILFSDVSREFGAEGGRKVEDLSIFHSRLKMPPVKKIAGRIAVISTCGSNNFHHWNYDTLPRLELLKRAGLLEEIDQFIIAHNNLKFQAEGLERFHITPDKIINPNGKFDFYIEAEYLYIPSLTEDLGTISPWVVSFLREIYLGPVSSTRGRKIYLSRKTVSTRKIINQEEVSKELAFRGYEEYIPDNYSIEETADFFSQAESIVSVHGSGLSNLPFISEKAKVLDIMAPFHQDAYYWMICNQRGAKYVALFAEGGHPDDDQDLVKNKLDADLLLDMGKLKEALDLVS